MSNEHDHGSVDLFELSRRRKQAAGKRMEGAAAHPAVRAQPHDLAKPENRAEPENRATSVGFGVQTENEGCIKNMTKMLLLAAVICVIIIGVWGWSALGGVRYAPVDTTPPDEKAEDAPDWPLREETGITNILLLGIDGDGGSGQRSDTMMLLTLDARRRVIRMTSILRDTYVKIPGRDKKTRINHAYAYGGAALSMQTVEANFRIRVDRYVGIDMDGLTVLVSKLGGVDLTLTAKEAKTINSHVKGSHLQAGKQHLNGAQATYYARIRKIDSDFGRTGRQRKLIGAMMTKFSSLSLLSQAAAVSEIMPYLTTNLSRYEMIAAGCKAAAMMKNAPEEMCVPVSGGYRSPKISGMAVLVPDLPKNCEEMHLFVFGSIPGE